MESQTSSKSRFDHLVIDEIKEVQMGRQSSVDGPASPLSQQSMMITLLPNMNEESRKSIPREPYSESLTLQVEEYFQTGKKICIDSLCFEQSREMAQSDNHHSKHKQISYCELLKELRVLKGNNYLRVSSSERYQNIIKNLNEIVREIQDFEKQFLSTIKTLKMKTIKHIEQAKKSFDNNHYEQVLQKVRKNFSYSTVIYALNEVQKFKKLRYDNLDYPQFKSNMLRQRIKEINCNHKVLCLEQLKEWIRYLQADNPNPTKTYNRAASTFLFKSLSEKSVFSYYLRSQDYLVLDCGKKLQRVYMNDKLPLCMIEKELDSSGIRLRINKKVKSITIGCGVLQEIMNKNFDNCFQSGVFMNSKGFFYFDKGERQNIFTFGQGDTISIYRRDNKIEFFKMVSNHWKGFSRRISAFKRDQKYYVGVFIKDLQGEVQILN